MSSSLPVFQETFSMLGDGEGEGEGEGDADSEVT